MRDRKDDEEGMSGEDALLSPRVRHPRSGMDF